MDNKLCANEKNLLAYTYNRFKEKGILDSDYAVSKLVMDYRYIALEKVLRPKDDNSVSVEYSATIPLAGFKTIENLNLSTNIVDFNNINWEHIFKPIYAEYFLGVMACKNKGVDSLGVVISNGRVGKTYIPDGSKFKPLFKEIRRGYFDIISFIDKVSDLYLLK